MTNCRLSAARHGWPHGSRVGAPLNYSAVNRKRAMLKPPLGIGP